MSLPGLCSPKRRERTMLGVSNKGRTMSPPRLCRQPNPRATVDESFMKNFNDQRHLVNSIRQSNMVEASTHHSYTVPPQLPAHVDLLKSMRSEPPQSVALAPVRPPKGIPDLLGQAQADTLRASKPSEPVVIGASPRRSSFPSGVSPRYNPIAYTPTASTADGTTRPTAAQRFMQGEKYSMPSTLQGSLPVPIQLNPRSGRTRRDDTLPLTQSSPGTGLYMGAEERYDANTRGLNIPRVMQEEKLRNHVANEVKTAVRREKEAAVIALREADGDRLGRIDEGRIRSKAMQRSKYQERMSSYKFTK